MHPFCKKKHCKIRQCHALSLPIILQTSWVSNVMQYHFACLLWCLYSKIMYLPFETAILVQNTIWMPLRHFHSTVQCDMSLPHPSHNGTDLVCILLSINRFSARCHVTAFWIMSRHECVMGKRSLCLKCKHNLDMYCIVCMHKDQKPWVNVIYNARVLKRTRQSWNLARDRQEYEIAVVAESDYKALTVVFFVRLSAIDNP